jgi:hypothetical protein
VKPCQRTSKITRRILGDRLWAASASTRPLITFLRILQVDRQKLMRVYGALMWSMGKVSQ